ncbi:MAG: DUF4405 domain-containing protein [Polyangiaceae bacterium]|nr:DUF4405 domain-containing protein [Polyangiaceae bacterium]
MWMKIVRALATPVPMALFFVTAVSGLMMFFHLGDRYVKGLHEWLSLVFVLGVVLHVALHWKAFWKHFRTRSFWGVAVTTALAGALFVVPALAKSREPGRPGPASGLQLMAEQAELADLAPLLRASPGALVERIRCTDRVCRRSPEGSTLGA